MTVWYNSYNNKFLSDRAHEEYFADLVSRRQTEEYFDKFLEENYSYKELFNFTDADRKNARARFHDWAREQAERDDVHDPFDVQLASDEVED